MSVFHVFKFVQMISNRATITYAPRNFNRTEPYMEPMILSGVFNEIMQENAQATLICWNDVFAINGVGNCVVQSLNINEKQRALPT